MNQLNDIDTDRAATDVTVRQVMDRDGSIVYRPLREIPVERDAQMGGTIDWDRVEAENRRARRADERRQAAQAARNRAIRAAKNPEMIATGSVRRQGKKRARIPKGE